MASGGQFWRLKRSTHLQRSKGSFQLIQVGEIDLTFNFMLPSFFNFLHFPINSSFHITKRFIAFCNYRRCSGCFECTTNFAERWWQKIQWRQDSTKSSSCCDNLQYSKLRTLKTRTRCCQNIWKSARSRN